MPKLNPENLDNLSIGERPLAEISSTTEIDLTAQDAVRKHVNDIFNFDSEEPREVQPSDRDIATSAVFDHAEQLCTEYVSSADKKVQRRWNKEKRITFPTAEIDGKEFQLSKALDPKTGTTTISMTRLNVPDSGFTIVHKDKAATLTLDVSDRPNALDDDHRYDDALNKATDWINRYAQAVGITPELWYPKAPLSEEEERLQEELEINRQTNQRVKRHRLKKSVGAIAITLGLTCAGAVGTEVFIERHRESNAEFDATHFLPDSAPTIHIGETKPVGDGSELSQEVIDTADFTNGGTRSKVIENAGPHFIRANEDLEVAPKGHGNSLTGDCEHIKLEGLSPRGTVKVVVLNKDIASNLEAHLDREEMRICNTQTDENASIKLKPRQLFIEITNPQG